MTEILIMCTTGLSEFEVVVTTTIPLLLGELAANANVARIKKVLVLMPPDRVATVLKLWTNGQAADALAEDLAGGIPGDCNPKCC